MINFSWQEDRIGMPYTNRRHNERTVRLLGSNGCVYSQLANSSRRALLVSFPLSLVCILLQSRPIFILLVTPGDTCGTQPGSRMTNSANVHWRFLLSSRFHYVETLLVESHQKLLLCTRYVATHTHTKWSSIRSVLVVPKLHFNTVSFTWNLDEYKFNA